MSKSGAEAMCVLESTFTSAGPDYLRVRGPTSTILHLFSALHERLSSDDHEDVEVAADPDPGRSCSGVSRLGTRVTSGPVGVEVEGTTAFLTGGLAELDAFFRHVELNLDGPRHLELLRVFEPAYAFVGPATHVDLIAE